MDLTRLVNLAKAGQTQAVEQLVDLYAPRLFGLLYRMIGSRPDAEDLLQETFVKVLRGLGSYREDGRFEPWLFSIAANLARDWLRRQGRSPVTALAGRDEDLEASFTFDGPSPEQTLAQAEQLDLLQQAVNELSPAEREIVSLRFFAQMSFKEIAEALQVPLGTALARAHRAIGHLRERLGGAEEAPSTGPNRGET